MAGNNSVHRGQQRDKPFRDALRIVAAELSNGEVHEYPRGSLRWNALQLLLKGDVPSIREAADRLDGKVAQAIVGDDEHAPLQFEDRTDAERARAIAVLLMQQSQELKDS